MAALGLNEKNKAPANILKETWNNNNVAITLYEGGTFKAYSSKRPSKVVVNKKAVTNYVYDGNVVTVNIKQQSKPVVSIYW